MNWGTYKYNQKKEKKNQIWEEKKKVIQIIKRLQRYLKVECSAAGHNW